MLDFQSVERPYPGLRPFEPWEAAIFFGREEHTDRLQEILKREHFLSVTGPSGCGKSSLVRAGLLPALPLGAVGTGSSWRFAIMRPGDRPILSLAHVLLEPQAFGQELRHVPPGKSDFTEQAIEAELRRGSLGFISLITDAKQHTDDKDCNLLLLVDQFEEIFTYAEAGARQADEADAFIDLLLHARKARESRIFVVLTMRTDFLGNCVRFLDLPEAINHSLYLTPRLTRDQLAQAMNGPARTFGGDLAPVLVDELVNAVANDPDQLPVLQHALARMWDRAIATGQHAPTLRLADLAEVGGVSKALSQHADEVLATLTPKQQLDAEWLFRAITDQRSAEAGGQMVRRPQSLQRIGVWSSRPWEA
jgi:energy-coupling factor transporter ATP-binding protein EcfA2